MVVAPLGSFFHCQFRLFR